MRDGDHAVTRGYEAELAAVVAAVAATRERLQAASVPDVDALALTAQRLAALPLTAGGALASPFVLAALDELGALLEVIAAERGQVLARLGSLAKGRRMGIAYAQRGSGPG